jgi:hypothetical protein
VQPLRQRLVWVRLDGQRLGDGKHFEEERQLPYLGKFAAIGRREGAEPLARACRKPLTQGRDLRRRVFFSGKVAGLRGKDDGRRRGRVRAEPVLGIGPLLVDVQARGGHELAHFPTSPEAAPLVVPRHAAQAHNPFRRVPGRWPGGWPGG